MDSPSSPSSSSGSSSCSSSPSQPFSLEHPHPPLPPSIAATVVRRLVAKELQHAGFEAAQQDVLEELEGIIFTFFGSALSQAHDLANHARRIRPNAKDVVESCRRLGVGGELELKSSLERTRHRVQALSDLPRLRYQRSTRTRVSSPPGPTLASDDEEDDTPYNEMFNSTPAAIASGIKTGKTVATKRTLAALTDQEELPKLPSKHSFKVTPAYPTPSLSAPFVPPSFTPHPSPQSPSSAALAHLATLRSRQNDSSEVASSLRNLIRRTSARPIIAPSDGALTDLGLGTGEELDVVDYSTEWYSSSTSPLTANALTGRGGTGRAKTVWKLRPGTTEVDPSALEDQMLLTGGTGAGIDKTGGLAEKRMGAVSGGGVVKRRRWRV